jgi:hypothetical protein
MITALAVDCDGSLPLPAPPLVVERVEDNNGGGRHRAGYIPGLSRHLPSVPDGIGFHIVLPDEDGWMSSNALFHVPDDNDAPAFLCIADDVRTAFVAVLTSLQSCAAGGRVIVILEYNGSVTTPDADDDVAGTVDVIGPVSMDSFWRLHDLQELYEESIVIIDA